MNRTNTGQENEEEERASVSTLAYFLNSQDKVRCANHLQNVGSLIHNPVADKSASAILIWGLKPERVAKT